MSIVVAKKLVQVIGGTPKIFNYCDDQGISNVDLYIGEDTPQKGLITCSTVGLSEYNIGLKLPTGKRVAAEFIGACSNFYEYFPNIVSSCAFNIISGNYFCRPGAVYPDMIAQYYEGIDMKHVMFSEPFLWDDLSNIEQEDKVITWLMIVPISDAELQYLKEYGSDALETLFEEKNIDIFDLERKSVV